MKKNRFLSILLTAFVLVGCGTPTGNTYIAPQQITDPQIAKVTPTFENQIERINNCDDANPTYNVSYKTIATQKATFEVSVGAGGLVTGTPLPPVLEMQLEARITAALAKDYGLTTEKNHDITLENPQGSFLEHTIEWKVTRVKGLIDVIYGDGIAQVAFDKIANVELYNRTSKSLGCDGNSASTISTAGETSPPTPIQTEAFQKMLDSAQVSFTDTFDNPLFPGWLRWGGNSSTLYAQNGTAFFLSGAQLHRNHGLQDNEACLVSLSFSQDGGFMLAGTPEAYGSDWRAWGVMYNPDLQPEYRMQDYFQEGIGESAINIYETFSLQGKADTSYNILLWVNDSASFTARVWEKDNPNIYGEKHFEMTDSSNWTNRKWYCNLLVDSGTVQVSSYSEIKLPQSP